MNTYKEYYQENVVPALMERFKFKSNMEAPRLVKITLNMGLGSAIADKKILEKAQEELTQIAGQKAVLTYAKKSIANFKLREGMPIGCKVTLRGQMMYDFFENLSRFHSQEQEISEDIVKNLLMEEVTTLWVSKNI